MKESPAHAALPVRIDCPADIDRCLPVLVRCEPRFAAVLDRVGPLPLRRRADGFGALAQAITGQQVSTASAAAIWARMEAAGLNTEAGVRAATDEELRAAGLSRPKQRYLRALAEARLDYGALRRMDAGEVIETLIAQPGIGRWTAEIYAKFALGHVDVFAAGDLALQEAARRLLDLPARPGEREMRAMAEAWTPVRAVAARALWAYYRLETEREGVT